MRGGEREEGEGEKSIPSPNHLPFPYHRVPSHPVKERAEQNEKQGNMQVRPPLSPFSHAGES